MSTTHAAPEWQSDPVITTIRAELARRGIRPAALPRLLGNSQAYWGRRMIGDTELSVSDLRLLADLLDLRVADFFVDDEKAPRPEPRSLDSLRARRDSNPQPSDVESNVVDVDFGADFDWSSTGAGGLAEVLAFPGRRS